MVRKILIFLAVCLLPLRAFAADFTATVDSNDVGPEGFALQLNLSGTLAKGDPDTSALAQSFTVAGESQSSSTSIINGTVKSSVGWVLELIPKNQGTVTVPPVTILTADGVLSTQPITLTVSGGSASNPVARPGAVTAQNSKTLVKVSAAVDNAAPYKSQPIHYTVTIVARPGVSDLALDDVSIDNAIVDKPAKPKVSDTVRNGVPAKIVEYDYLITPLQPGHLVIPPPAVHGDMEVAEQFPQPFDQAFSNDPFKMLQNMNNFSSFAASRPFHTAGNEVDLDVKPPAAAMNPWLPLYALQIKDEWGSTANAKVGEPLTRKIMLLAEGGSGTALPNLEALQDHADFKVYADKAETGNDTGKTGDRVIGWRTENYTLIPLNAGKLAVPAIKVAWWDIANNRIAYAELPGKTIDVLPGATSVAPSAPAIQTAPAVNPPSQSASAAPPVVRDNHAFFYGIIAALLAVIALMAFQTVRLQRKMSGAFVQPKETVSTASPEFQDALPLKQVKTPEELKTFLQSYAARHWNAPRNAPLEKLFSNAPSEVQLRVQEVAKELASALYAGRAVDLEALKNQTQAVLSMTAKPPAKVTRAGKLPDLNPG